ncbi:MAG: Rieske 2Fe-2S domain-containing protein [Alphaproteobacteria bacterium]|nr:Rieske 2Fe-2S domain-containing protein [Alphaproteobacteria bacterium]
MRFADATDYVKDDPARGMFRVHRDLFRDSDLFELEMAHIFEGGWVYVCLDSQVPEPHDFFVTRVGRRSVMVTRDGKGELHCFFNTCRHRGATLCHTQSGNCKTHICEYHGWSYGSDGANVDIKDREQGEYGAPFDETDHNLIPVPRFERYRELCFVSLNPDVMPLADYLGDARTMIDLVMDQGDPMELIPGRSHYTYAANWKLQMDNGKDGYHLTSTHRGFAKIVYRREAGESGNKQVVSPNFRNRFAMDAGMFTFDNGHGVIWADLPNPENQPLHGTIDAVRKRVGETRAKWMLRGRNLTIFPNLQLADTTSLILRTFTPLAVDRTEMTLHSLGPVGEPDEMRAKRIRQHEDFFNVSGLATPDDTVCYEDCQTGLEAMSDDWLQSFERGIAAVKKGPDEQATELGINPAYSLDGSYGVQCEVVYHAAYREWVRRLSNSTSLAAE